MTGEDNLPRLILFEHVTMISNTLNVIYNINFNNLCPRKTAQWIMPLSTNPADLS